MKGRERKSLQLPFIGNYTWGVNGVYFNDDYVFVSSSNLPDYPVGPFSKNDPSGLVGSVRPA